MRRSLASFLLASGLSVSLDSRVTSSYSRETFSSSSHSRRLLQYGNVPPNILPATHYIPLTLAADGYHYHMPVTYNNQTLNVIVDTASSDLMVLNSLYCDQVASHPPGSCYVANATEQNATGGTGLVFRLTIDNEYVLDLEPKRIVAELGFKASVMGTSATKAATRTSDALLSSKINFARVRPPSDVMHSFPDAGGLLGFSYAELSNFGVAAGLSLLVSDTSPKDPNFALDLNAEGQESKLWVGGIEESYRDRLIWGWADNTPFHTFLVSDLRVCGLSLIGNFTDYVFRGIVDTGSTCLGLPAEIFDSLMSWLPVTCRVRSFLPGFRSDLECFLMEDVPAVLPTLSFAMSSNKPSPLLHIPLDDLLLENRSLCIRRLDAVVASDGSYSLSVVDLAFGNRVLRSLFTAFHISTGQLGMANKDPAQTSSNIQCVPRTICKGMQTAYTAFNQCADPSCTDYYFFALDPDTKACYLTPTFHIIAGVLLALFLGGEVLMTELELWVEKKIAHTFPRTPL